MFNSSSETIEHMMLPGNGLVLPPLSFAGPVGPHFVGLPRAIKRAQDIVVAALLLLVFGLPMLIAALLIRLESSGPALFCQRRVGENGNSFLIWKFRTMRERLVQGDELRQARPGDPRITRIGHWLRCLSLDELPQLVNVLRGEMSLVGPRPHAPGTCAGGRLFELSQPALRRSPSRTPRHHRSRPGARLARRDRNRG